MPETLCETTNSTSCSSALNTFSCKFASGTKVDVYVREQEGKIPAVVQAQIQEQLALHTQLSVDQHELFVKQTEGTGVRKMVPFCDWLTGAAIGGAVEPSTVLLKELFVILRLRAGKGGFGKQIAKRGRSYHDLKRTRANTQRQQGRRLDQLEQAGAGQNLSAGDRAVEEVASQFRFSRTRAAARKTLGGSARGVDATAESKAERQKSRDLKEEHQAKVAIAQERVRNLELLDMCTTAAMTRIKANAAKKD